MNSVKLLLLSALILLFYSCSHPNKTITLKGEITGETPDYIYYSNPINGHFFGGFKKKTHVDGTGKFEIKLALDQAAFLELTCNNEVYHMLVEPQIINYNISINTRRHKNGISVDAPSTEAQSVINKLSYYSPFALNLQQSFVQDTSTLEDIKRLILDTKQNKMAPLEQLLGANKISQQFYNTALNDRNTYYNIIFNSIIITKYQQAFQKKNTSQLQLIRTMLDSICTYTLEKLEHKVGDAGTQEYNQLYNYCLYAMMKRSEFKMDSFQTKMRNANKDGKIHAKILSESKALIPKPKQEFFTAAYLYQNANQKKYEKELISLYEQFNQTYPSSEYTKYLTPLITTIKSFHTKIERDFPDEITFFENADSLNSFNDITSSKELKGKRIFVDVWATWCGPCKGEFAYKKSLLNMLEKHNTEMLYISIDRDDRDKDWKNMIKYYDLNGHHIRANKQLMYELGTLFGKGNGEVNIPWYIIINENGEIVKLHANRPSNYSALEKELEQLL